MFQWFEIVGWNLTVVNEDDFINNMLNITSDNSKTLRRLFIRFYSYCFEYIKIG